MRIKRYFPQAPPLKKLIKYFWVLDRHERITLNHKILPVNNIDIIFNFMAPIEYEKNGRTLSTPGSAFFTGLMKNHMVLKQHGRVLTIGVSFFPAGLYPFLTMPVSEFKNRVVGLDDVFKGVVSELEERLWAAERVSDKIAILEAFFLGQLDIDRVPTRSTSLLLDRFHANNTSVGNFCNTNGVHPRRFERLFNMYVGAPPKQFSGLTRFQVILNHLIRGGAGNLTDLAHNFDFHDQTHFIKDFKSYTGSSPKKFIKEKQSLRQIMNVS